MNADIFYIYISLIQMSQSYTSFYQCSVVLRKAQLHNTPPTLHTFVARLLVTVLKTVFVKTTGFLVRVKILAVKSQMRG